MQQTIVTKNITNERLFNKPIYYWMILFALFSLALGIRGYGIGDDPFDFHPVKQFRSALTARTLYYQSTSDPIPDWKVEVSEANLQDIGLLAFPVLDQTAALIYRYAGKELLMAPRLLSALFWLIGGVFLFLIARKIMPIDAAIISLAFYLFLPFGVLASQSFQPDSLMIMFMIIGIYTIILYNEDPKLSRLLLASLISLLGALVKPVVLPIFFSTFFALGIQRVGLREAIVNSHTIAFFGLVFVPTALYYGNGVFFESEQLNQQANKSFVPTYFLEFRFWDGWLKRIRIVMGFTYFIGGIIGALLYQDRRTRALMYGLWIGYFLMCIIFNYTIGTHDYYHLPLVPIVALSIGSITTAILDKTEGVRNIKFWYPLFFGVLIVALFLAAGTSVQQRRKLPSFEASEQIAREIGNAVDHSIRTIHLAPFQGHPLMYYGELSGIYWPYWYDIRDEELWEGRSVSTAERFSQFTANHGVDYFIVADKEEFNNQEDLKKLLTEKFPKLTETNDYIIFDLR